MINCLLAQKAISEFMKGVLKVPLYDLISKNGKIRCILLLKYNFRRIVTNIFTKEESNLGRQNEIDLLRGFTAILLVIVHTGLYLGNNINKGLWVFCDIIGSEPCAPVLMVLMGISIAYSHHKLPANLLKRGIHLFFAGYFLNFFRSLLPLFIFGNADEWASVEAFFVVDILQFAGLSFMLIALLKQLRFSNIAILSISIIMVIVDQFIMFPGNISLKSDLLTGIVNLFCPTTEWSCFPLITWFIFPAFGLTFGDVLTHCINKNKLYSILLPFSLCGTVYVYYQFYILYPNYTSYYWGNNFYYMGLKNVLLTILIVCFTLSFWFFAEKTLPVKIKKWLRFLSKNLNTYYIVSWIIISILIHLQAVYSWNFGTYLTIGIMILLIILCALITELWLRIKEKLAKPCSKMNVT